MTIFVIIVLDMLPWSDTLRSTKPLPLNMPATQLYWKIQFRRAAPPYSTLTVLLATVSRLERHPALITSIDWMTHVSHERVSANSRAAVKAYLLCYWLVISATFVAREYGTCIPLIVQWTRTSIASSIIAPRCFVWALYWFSYYIISYAYTDFCGGMICAIGRHRTCVLYMSIAGRRAPCTAQWQATSLVAQVVRPILAENVHWNTFWHWCNIQTDVRNIGLTCVTYYSSMLPIWLLVWY